MMQLFVILRDNDLYKKLSIKKLVDLLILPMTPDLFLHQVEKTKLALLSDQSSGNFSLTEKEKDALFKILVKTTFLTKEEFDCYIKDLRDIPGRWWELYGYPLDHKIGRFCSCYLCDFFYYRFTATNRMPGEIVNQKPPRRLDSLGQMTDFKC